VEIKEFLLLYPLKDIGTLLSGVTIELTPASAPFPLN
jgi:hypothetical protein